MKHPRRRTATLLLWLTAIFAASNLCFASSPAQSDPHQSAGGGPGVRARVIGALDDPDLAVLVLAAGTLLIFLECNRPGAILPGTLGLLLVLSGIYGLSLHPLHAPALIVLLAAVAALASSARSARPLLLGCLGSCALSGALWKLVAMKDQRWGVHLSVAILAGVLVGSSATLLGRVAERARRNKAILLTGALGDPDLPPAPPSQEGPLLPE